MVREPDQRIADHRIVELVRLGIGVSEDNRKSVIGLIVRADGRTGVGKLSFGVRSRG